jgi:hypothetical protein
MFTICILIGDEYTYLVMVIIGLNVETISADVFKAKKTMSRLQVQQCIIK